MEGNISWAIDNLAEKMGVATNQLMEMYMPLVKMNAYLCIVPVVALLGVGLWLLSVVILDIRKEGKYDTDLTPMIIFAVVAASFAFLIFSTGILPAFVAPEATAFNMILGQLK